MKALLENEVVNLYTQDRNISEFDALIEQARTADAVLKNKIENEIVSNGLKFVPELINHIPYMILHMLIIRLSYSSRTLLLRLILLLLMLLI